MSKKKQHIKKLLSEYSKLRKESERIPITEITQEHKLENRLDKLTNKPYIQFVKGLSQLPGNEKLQTFLKKNKNNENDKFNISKTTIPAKNLHPTQNEVDITKSLSYPLKKPDEIKLILSGGPIKLGNNEILTFNEKNIIDGHHRWSQVYVINPDCHLDAVNLEKEGIKPLSALKATEEAIYVSTGTVPTENVQGTNLFKANEKQIKDYVLNTMNDEVFEVFQSELGHQSPDHTADYIWNNVKNMQIKNKPVLGAPSRNVMPQTDINLPGILDLLSNGEINIKEAKKLNELVRLLEKYSNKKVIFEDEENNLFKPRRMEDRGAVIAKPLVDAMMKKPDKFEYNTNYHAILNLVFKLPFEQMLQFFKINKDSITNLPDSRKTVLNFIKNLDKEKFSQILLIIPDLLQSTEDLNLLKTKFSEKEIKELTDKLAKTAKGNFTIQYLINKYQNIGRNQSVYVFVGGEEFKKNNDGSYRKTLDIENLQLLATDQDSDEEINFDDFDQTRSTSSMLHGMGMRARAQNKQVYSITTTKGLLDDYVDKGSEEIDEYILNAIDERKKRVSI